LHQATRFPIKRRGMSETNHSPPPDPADGVTSATGISAADHKRRTWHWIAWPGVMLLAFLAAALFWRRHEARQSQPPSMPPPIPVVVAQAEKGDIGVYVTGLGTVTPLNTITVTTRVDGQLMAVKYKEGEKVRQGDPLVEIDPRPFQVALEQAEAQLVKDQAALQNAQIDLTRYEELITKNAVSQQILQTQRSTVAQAEATVKNDQATIAGAKLNLIYCHITAPIGGRIGLRLVDPGNFVSAGAATPLLVITQTQPISVIFTIPEQALASVRAALRAGKTLPVEAIDRNGQQTLAKGELTTLDNQIDQTTGTLRLRATVPNADDALFPNQFVNARMLVQDKRGVTLIPNAAVQRNAQATFVYVVNPDQSVAIRNVTLGTIDDERSEVVMGIRPNELVVTQGVDRLQAGSRVVATWPDSEDARRRALEKSGAVATSGKSGRKAGKAPAGARP
jgi:multidrug efflux system membrane fusion protein